MPRLSQLFRPLRREPGFSALAVITLALGLGATIAIFTIVNSVLLEQLAYPEADRLVFVDHEAPALELPSMGISRKLFLHYAENNNSLEGIGLFDQYQATLTDGGSPVRVGASSVSPSYFRVVGITPALGRSFNQDEGQPDAPPVAVLSHSLWRDRFGSSSEILGSAIRIDGVPHEIIGVLAPGADRPNAASNDTQIYRNRILDATRVQLGSFSDIAVARLGAGRTLQNARADFERLLSNLEETFPEERSAPVLARSGFAAKLDPLLERQVGPVRQTLWILLAVVALILLIACANVANLFLVRVEERSAELSIRSALGASRRRLVTQLMGESLLLSLLAGALGLGFAYGTVALIRRFGPSSLPRLEEIAINSRVLLFTLTLALFAGLLFGLLPALRATARSAVAAIKDGARAGTGRERQLLRAALVTAQVALGLLLLIGSGLLVRTLLEVRSVDPGFDPEQAISFRVVLPEADYPEAQQRVQFIEDALARLGSLPGVDQATVASALPLAGNTQGSGYSLQEFPRGPDDVPVVFMQTWMAPGHLATMGMRLLEGRALEPADHQQRTGNVLVSQSVAKRFWPEGSGVGKRIAPGRPSEEESGWYTIVGVVADVQDFGLRTDPPLRVYRPLLALAPDEPDAGGNQDIGGGLSFVVRTSLSTDAILAAARSEILSIDPNLPISSVQTLEQLILASQAQLSFTVVVLLISAALALTLASIGLYGVVSYIVSKRTHEIGVRMAIGALPRDVRAMIVGTGMKVALLGIVLGLALAFASTRLLDSLLFGVGALDPLTFVLVPTLLAAVVAISCYVPARRASRIAPVVALKQ